MGQRKDVKPGHGKSTAIAVVLLAAAGLAVWFGVGIGGAVPGTSPNRAAISAEKGLAATLAAPAPAPLQGGLPTRVVLGSVGIDAPVAEVGVVTRDGRSEWAIAWRAVGHHMDSARPGQPGNLVLTGHISVADNRNLAAFATLPQAKRGDLVEVYVGDQVYQYEVSKVSVVPAAAVKVLRSDHSPTVTLITCTPDLKNRIVVVGTLI